MYRKSVAAAAVLFLLLAITSPAHAKPLGWSVIGHHTVRSGETIYCIARAYGVSPSGIATQNGITHPSLIRPGQVLAIPAVYASLPAGPTCTRQFTPSTSTCACRSYHTVARGENLYRISLRYGVGMWRIAECNTIYNLNAIRVGCTLCIPAAQ